MSLPLGPRRHQQRKMPATTIKLARRPSKDTMSPPMKTPTEKPPVKPCHPCRSLTRISRYHRQYISTGLSSLPLVGLVNKTSALVGKGARYPARSLCCFVRSWYDIERSQRTNQTCQLIHDLIGPERIIRRAECPREVGLKLYYAGPTYLIVLGTFKKKIDRGFLTSKVTLKLQST